MVTNLRRPFKNTDPLPGLAMGARQYLPDGSVEVQVEAAPGMPPQKFRLQFIAGQWKLEAPF